VLTDGGAAHDLDSHMQSKGIRHRYASFLTLLPTARISITVI